MYVCGRDGGDAYCLSASTWYIAVSDKLREDNVFVINILLGTKSCVARNFTSCATFEDTRRVKPCGDSKLVIQIF